MKNKLSLSCVFLLVALTAFAQDQKQPRRISSKVIDLGKVHPIYMVPGMATIIEIPGPVTGIRTGSPEDIEYFQPAQPHNEVTLILKKINAQPTNLIIRSGKRKFVFDIVPSRTRHEDSVEVVGAYGGPQLEGGEPNLIDSSETTTAPVPSKGAQ